MQQLADGGRNGQTMLVFSVAIAERQSDPVDFGFQSLERSSKPKCC